MNPRELRDFIKMLSSTGRRTEERVEIPRDQIKQLCTAATRVLSAESSLLELPAPINICGDIHGQRRDLLRLFDLRGLPPEANYLFLGDYVDRGPRSIKTICLLLAYKIQFPNNFFLLRGNHESASINRTYGFYEECVNKYDEAIWEIFNDCFDCLPVAALIEGKILCMHGGLSPHLDNLDQIRDLRRPAPVPESGLLCDLLWSDPDRDIQGWEENTARGCSYIFGPDVVIEFLENNNLDLICRAHQVVDGYKYFAGGRLVTIFSAPNYGSRHDNDGAIMSIDKNLKYSFLVVPAN